MKVVIIGGGSAGISAATRLRRMNEKAQIIVLEKSDEFAVANCGLTYLLAGLIKSKDELIGATIEQMRDVFRIDVRLGNEVIGIDRSEKRVMILNHQSETYDKLIIATGALQLRPDINGILGDNIFTIRSISGIGKIRDYYFGTGALRVLILGAGSVGIEAAEAFSALKAKVYLIDMSNHILPNMDKDMAEIVEQELKDKGIKLYLNTQVRSFGSTEVKLSSGKKLKYDMAIIATGNKPDIKLPIMADLGVGQSGGIKTNKFMQTNDADIYACGDNVEIINKITNRPERWSNASSALKQARVAADHICGEKGEFSNFIGTDIIKVFDYIAATTGCSETKLQAAGIKYHRLYLRQNNHAGYYPNAQKLHLKLLFAADGQILGFQAVGKAGVPERINAVSALIQRGGSISDLINLEVAYSPPFANAKDALNNLGSLAQEVLSGKLHTLSAIDKDTLLVDIRSPESFARGHQPGAINFPLPYLRESYPLLPKNKKMALYDNSGYGAYIAYQILAQRGFDNVYMLNHVQ